MGDVVPFIQVPQILINDFLPNMVDSDGKKSSNKDAILLYIYLLSYVNRQKKLSSGAINKRYGYAWPSYTKITQDLNITRGRISKLCKILESYYLLECEGSGKGSKRVKLYKPVPPSDKSFQKLHGQTETGEEINE